MVWPEPLARKGGTHRGQSDGSDDACAPEGQVSQEYMQPPLQSPYAGVHTPLLYIHFVGWHLSPGSSVREPAPASPDTLSECPMPVSAVTNGPLFSFLNTESSSRSGAGLTSDETHREDTPDFMVVRVYFGLHSIFKRYC
jgi:hypothetical protein